MASYSLNLFDDGSGNFVVEVMRSPSSVAAGGTGVILPHLQDNAQDGGAFRTGPFTINGATSANPIVLSCVSTGSLQVGDTIAVQGVLGTNANMAANGTWRVTALGTGQITIGEAIANGQYSSGGTAYALRPTKIPAVALQTAIRGVMDDRSLNG